MPAGPKNLRAKFEVAAAAAKRTRKRPNEATQLTLYAYYRQATQGNVEGERPSRFLDFQGIARYNAWAKLKGMSKDDAMENYINEVALLNLA